MKRLVFIADDFGLSEAVNEAVIRAYREGALTGASLMMGQPGTASAIALARDHPGLEIGWHLHLCDSLPLTQPSWPWGASPVRAGFRLAFGRRNRELIRREIGEQWSRFEGSGLACRFVNSHHHLHFHPWVDRELMRTFGGPEVGWLRGRAFHRFAGEQGRRDPFFRVLAWLLGTTGSTRRIPESTTVWGVDRLHSMQTGEVRTMAACLGAGLHEFMFHPRMTMGDRDLETLLELRAADVAVMRQ